METLRSYFAQQATLDQISFPIAIDDLIRYLKDSYFTDLLSCSMGMIAFFIFQNKKNENKAVTPFKYYFLGYAILRLSSFFGILFLMRSKYTITIYLDFIFTVCEFIIFANFFKILFLKRTEKNVLQYLEIIFIGSSLFSLVQDLVKNGGLQQSTLQNLFILQAVILIIPCIIYFKNVFLGMPTVLLLREPAFWIITGLSFFMLCTLPFSLLANYFEKTSSKDYNLLYTIFNIFYCFLFFMILKAQSCEPKFQRT